MNIDRDELQKLADAATAGPWVAKTCEPCAEHGREDVQVWNESGTLLIAQWMNEGEDAPADAAFIAASREAVPALRDQLEQAEAERDYRKRENEELSVALNLALTGEEVQTGERYSNAVALAQAVLRADRAEARIQAVEAAIKTHGHTDDWGVQCVYVNQLRRALDGDA